MPAPVSIALLPLPNFTMTPFASLLDVLRLAADEGDASQPSRLRWTLIGPGLEPIRSSGGVEVRPWEALGDPARFDYVVVCGGLLRRDLRADPLVEDFLRRAAGGGATILGLCTGVFMLARAGLLAGRRACVSWFHLAEFREEFPDLTPVATQLYVDDGKIVTCSGGTGALDVGALIVARHLGRSTARKALHILQVEEARPPTFPQPQPATEITADDPRIRRAILAIEQALDRPADPDQLARAAGLSRRQFERLFRRVTGVAPAAFAADLRLRYADWLLRTTPARLTDIAERCGFSDSSHFSRSYRAAFGRSPSDARRAAEGFLPGERRPYAREDDRSG